MFAFESRFLFSPVGLLFPDVNSVMPIVGVILIFLCFLAYFFPATRALREKNQVFEGAGVKMQVSVLTVFVVMGFALSLSSFALQYKGYLDQAEKFTEKEQQYKEDLKARDASIELLKSQNEKERPFDMSILLRPEAKNGAVNTHTGAWTCDYKIFNSGHLSETSKPIKAPTTTGIGAGTVRVSLQNITLGTTITELTLSNGKRRWVYPTFAPLNDTTLDIKEDDDADTNDH
jgi:uncharacterized membrane protein YwzB